MLISRSVVENIAQVKSVFRDSGDIVMRDFSIGKHGARIFMVYMDNLVNGASVEDSIMTNLMCRYDAAVQAGMLDMIMTEAIAVGETGKMESLQEAYDAILTGDTVLFMEGNDFALRIATKGFPSRGVNQAETEVVVQGPKDSFNEVMATNIVLIRRRIRDTHLKLKRKRAGERTKTDIALMYMEDLVQPHLLQEVERQLDCMNVDAIYDSGYMEQLMEERWMSPYPQLQMTERPDKASAALLEGRIVLVVDNTPFVILLPVTLNVFFQAAEDYYDRWGMMSLVRALRYLAAFAAVTLPGLYIAFSVYHPQLLPTALALKIALTRQAIPFSVVGEVILMEIAFELLREAGIRLPSPVSSTIGIVGGIIIGSAAIEAGLVSPSVVIVSALTGICTFVIPNVSFVSGLRLSKYVVILMSSVLGLFGFWLAMLLLITHLAGLTSYGIPFLYPFCSSSVNDDMDWEDSIFRLPLIKMKRRPIFSRESSRKRKGEKK